METGGATTTGGTTTASFGESEYGERLNYEIKPKYQDLWAFICFYGHVVLIFILVIFFWAVSIPDKINDPAITPSPTLPSATDSEDEMEQDEDTTGFWITLLAALFAGILFGLVWLQCMKQFAQQIIKILLFVQIACWALVTIIAAIYNVAAAIVPGICLLITCLYTWWYVIYTINCVQG